MRLTRRRFIAVSAAAAGLPLLPMLPQAAATPVASATLRSWHGVALGADAILQLNHPDPAIADRLIERALAEVHRLERIFSLYREDSSLSRLNASGSLADPPMDFVRILAESEEFSRATGGVFDISVQPLWDLYAAHFLRDYTDAKGPTAGEISAVLTRVGHGSIEVDTRHVRLRQPGMGITLNGIGQGYITDRVAEILIANGIDRALVDMGETRALGERPSGGPWLIGLEDPRSPGAVAETIPVRERAVATSGGYGTEFDAAGRFNHLFDPRTGATSSLYLSVSVIAPTATMADALSTAFSLMPLNETQRTVDRYRIHAHFTLPDGRRIVQGT
jgi:FAD:protein FMN transferase